MKRIFIIAGVLLFAFCNLTAFGQTIRISGTVTDAADGSGIPGASIVVKGTTVGVITNIDGRFELNAAPTATLVFSFVGYTTQEVLVDGKSIINVSLVSAMIGLEEVVVTAYGSTRRDAITGSVGIVSSEKLEQIPIASFDQILQGQTAGLSSVSSGGRPGAHSVIRIRGTGTINASATPLYIIDGVALTEHTGSRYDNPLSGINPNDIENISVLKDASAAALYGSRAANGVIIVTTKRGKAAERSNLTYRGMFGTATQARDNFNMMTTEQKLQFEQDNKIRNRTPEQIDSMMNINTNWRDVMFKDAAMQSHEISSSGGTGKTNYYISGSYFSQEGILHRSDYERIAGRLNLDHYVSEKIRIGASTNLSFEESNYTVAEGGYGNNIWNPVFAAYLINPYEQPYDEDGEWNTSMATYTWGNPRREIELNQDYNNTLKILGNVYAEYEPIKKLQLRSTIGTDFFDYTYDDYLHPTSVWGSASNGSLTRGLRRAKTTTFTNTGRYSYIFATKHNTNILIGYETTKYESESFGGEGIQFANDKVRIPSAAAEANAFFGSAEEFAVESYFSQFTYAYDSKYFLDASIRRDGSSRFGRDNRYANFWSVGLSWNMKKESFVADIDQITELKLRSSMGTAGNYAIGNYDHLGLYSVSGSYNGMPGSLPIRPANPNLTWEESEMFNVGLEFRLYDRISATVEYYNRYTKEMLFGMPVTLTSGFVEERRNIGEMSNKGIEATIDLDMVRTENFNWNLNANFTYNKNKIEALYLDKDSIPWGTTILIIGQPYGTLYYNRYAGVNPANGTPLWYDENGNITNVFRDSDQVPLDGMSFLAPYFGGFTSNMSYKGIQLNAFFTYVLNRYMLNNTAYFLTNQSNFGGFNQNAAVLDHWKEPGDNVHYPLYGQVPASIFDTRFVEDASFLRLRNITLSYNLPSKVLQTVKLRNIRLYVQGQNLWTLTSYTGWDPEFPGATELNAYPAVKTYSFGIDIGL
jgi:TonB-linked SusC/RagA family outer membrane protein